MVIVPKYLVGRIVTTLGMIALLALAWIWFPGRQSANQAEWKGVVVPAEVDLKDLPSGDWVKVFIPISNQTGQPVTIFDVAPT